MTHSLAPSWSSSQAHIQASGDLCLAPLFLRPDLSDNPSRQVFELLEGFRVPSHLPLQPFTSLSATGKNRFNTQ